LSRICEAEQVKAEPEALVAIARASEGSVRDSLSLLDQAIAYEAGTVTAEGVRNMLGLADRAQVMDLFEAVMKGDLVSSFKLLGEQHDLGADPDKVLREMARVTHLVTRLKVIPKAAADRGLTEDERLRGKTLADKLSVRALSQTWQILLKGVDEVTMSGQPLIAAEMVLVRLAYAADLPTPDEALRTLRNMPQATASAPPVASAPPASAPRAAALPPVPAAVGGNLAVVTPRAEPGPTLSLRSFEDVVALAAEKREIVLKTALENDVHLVRFEDGKIEFSLEDGANRSLPNDLARLLDRWTGKRWVVALSREAGQPTIRQRRDADRQELRTSLEQHPLVQSVLRSFPGAKIVDVRSKADKAAEADDEVDVEVDAGVTAGTDDDDADMSEPVM
jgi:DNA polymerase-3 subunit gamma/tau